MQDSIEDYIKISRNTKQEESIKINKDIQLTAQRRKECNARAVKIVEFSIEGKLRPEIFIKCLPFIDQSHYQDIVEERVILKLCGYSICGERLPEMPKKQYYISTKSNKVYDITERKNYCSNFCYKASLHIKKQIDDTPIWLRSPDVIPEYQLLAPTEKGLPGECVDQGLVKPEIEPAFTSVSIFTEVSLKDIVANEKGKEKLNKGKGTYKKSSKHLKSTMQTITENAEQLEEEEDTTEQAKIPTKTNNKKMSKKHEHAATLKILPVIDENEEKADTNENVKVNSESSKSIPRKTRRKSSKPQKIEIESVIQRAFKEWLTLDTYIFIHGESKVKEVLSEKKLSDYFEELKITELRRDQQIKYMNICKRLQLQEMADEKFDNALIGNTKLKPVPDYRKLKEENKDLNVKVKCFYSGVLHEKEDSNFPTKINKKSEEISGEMESPGVLPLVDVNSQNAMRRKIFLTSINKSMQHLLQSLRVTNFSAVLSDIQTLVKTFHLKADNIVFKPILWNYIAIVLLNVLSLRDKIIKTILEERQSEAIIELQLNALPSKIKFIDDIMANIKNIDVFVENYISTK